MTWDATLPLGSEAISNGDNRIRELKTDLATALAAEGTFPGSDTANPVYYYTPSYGNTASRPTGTDKTGRLYINTQINVVEHYVGGAWVYVATMIPSTTKMVFYQATVPTGWTAVAANDKFLRVVTGGGTGGTTGGTVAASTTLAHSHTVNSHAHSISASGTHTHTTPAHQHQIDNSPFAGNVSNPDSGAPLIYSLNADGDDLFEHAAIGAGALTAVRRMKNQTDSSGSGTSGASGDHDHGGTGAATPGTDTQFAGPFAYADVTIGAKD